MTATTNTRLKTYEFEVELSARIVLRAATRAQATKAAEHVLIDGKGFDSALDVPVHLISCSVSLEDGGAISLDEVDGKPVW